MFDEIYTKTRDWGGRQLNYAGNSLCWLGSVVTTNPEELYAQSERRYQKLDAYFRRAHGDALDLKVISDQEAEVQSLSVLARSGVNVCDSVGNKRTIGGGSVVEQELKKTFMTFFTSAGVDEQVVLLAFLSFARLSFPISTFVTEKFVSDIAQNRVFLGTAESVVPTLKLPGDNVIARSFDFAAPVISAVATNYLLVDLQVNFHQAILLDKDPTEAKITTEKPLIAARHRFFVGSDGIHTDTCAIDLDLQKLGLPSPPINLTS